MYNPLILLLALLLPALLLPTTLSSPTPDPAPLPPWTLSFHTTTKCEVPTLGGSATFGGNTITNPNGDCYDLAAAAPGRVFKSVDVGEGKADIPAAYSVSVYILPGCEGPAKVVESGTECKKPLMGQWEWMSYRITAAS